MSIKIGQYSDEGDNYLLPKLLSITYDQNLTQNPLIRS